MTGSTLSRRSFIKQCVIGGVAVYSAPLLMNMNNAQAAAISPELLEQWKGNNKPNFRLDGIAKVTGEKIYGRDYRAIDIPDWPDAQTHAYVLRVNKADRVFTGIDLTWLPENMQPNNVITANMLAADSVELPAFYGDKMLLAEGDTPDYLGHPVALLLFDDFTSFKRAKVRLQFSEKAIKYGEIVPLTSLSKDPYSAWRIIRTEGEDGATGKDKYSTLQDGLFFANYDNHKPVWPTHPDETGDAGARGMFYAQQMSTLLDKQQEDKAWFMLDKTYQTQSVEPMMMEPECFNGWFDSTNNTLHVVITCQSPQDFYSQAGEMLAHSPLAGKIENLVVHSPFIGGGFGAKDHSVFPYYGLLAAMYSDKPVRLANDRFEQFQAGLKRHPFTMHNRLAIDKETLKFKAVVSDMTLDGGGRKNFTDSVTMVGASALQSIYYLPQNDITAVAYPSQTPDCGSMRGYGTLQSMAAMEMMVNESAELLDVDPFQLRLTNLMEPGYRNTQGAIPNGTARYREMLELAQQHDIWVNRVTNKAKFETDNPGRRYGVGYGIATKDYGNGAQAPSAYVSVANDGSIVVRVSSMEMGTGTQTAQGMLISRYLGNMADDVSLAEIQLWDAMQLKETDSPYLISQERQNAMAKDPRWTPVAGMASSASQSAYYQSHATENAARVIFEHGLWPAAVAIWKKHYFNGEYAVADFGDIGNARWVDGKLTASGYPPLPLEIVAKQAHMMGLVTGVMVHGFNRWAWTEAEFDVEGQCQKLAIDAMALQYGEGASLEKQALMAGDGFHLLDRVSVNYPLTSLNNAMVTYYAPCGTLAEIAIHEGSGEVEVLRTHTWLECGRVLVEKLVEGQIEGGLVMGLGHALHEYLPSDAEGAGNGTWNLNRYQVPLAKHVGVWNLTHTILPPLSDTDPSKGIAEVVMIPIVPALVEAIYQASGARFYHLPITAKEIKKALV
ncbi:molybdopterin-dependent oxidoreductase [Photobacterium profundum]|uniref:xanthine dehydrogenase family protein molybdopterin-binding subunit n=1 Tax=Photobacterium profundum TaxID=74109 RepID=UPI003D0E10F5